MAPCLNVQTYVDVIKIQDFKGLVVYISAIHLHNICPSHPLKISEKWAKINQKFLNEVFMLISSSKKNSLLADM